jgi:ATP-binding cassette subfamily B protein
MRHILKLNRFFKPYWKSSFWALVLLISVVIMDLAIPRLIQRIIDQGIARNDLQVILSTTLVMLGLTLLSAICHRQ